MWLFRGWLSSRSSPSVYGDFLGDPAFHLKRAPDSLRLHLALHVLHGILPRSLAGGIPSSCDLALYYEDNAFHVDLVPLTRARASTVLRTELRLSALDRA